MIYKHKNKPLEKIEEGLVTGDLPAIMIEEEAPSFHWNGARVPAKLLRKTVAFAKHVYDKHGGEVQWRLLYHEERHLWAVVVLRQFISNSLESEECGNDGDIEEGLKRLGKGWVYNGTGHSHCNADAFMSSTDEKNEREQNGLHYTVGHLDKDKFDLHVRYSFRGIIYEVDIDDVFEPHDRRMGCLPKFQKYWKYMLSERPPRPAVQVIGKRTSPRSYNPSHTGWQHRGRYHDPRRTYERHTAEFNGFSEWDIALIETFFATQFGVDLAPAVEALKPHIALTECQQYFEGLHMEEGQTEETYVCVCCRNVVKEQDALCKDCQDLYDACYE